MDRDGAAARARSALQDAGAPLWFPALAPTLAALGARELERATGLAPAAYGTGRVLLGDPAAARDVVGIARAAPGAAGGAALTVEWLPDALAAACAGPGVRLFGAAAAGSAAVLGRIAEALDVLGTVPTVAPTVAALIRALHAIDAGDDEVDMSFSHPLLPFTAFVSVPGTGAVMGALRVAEALLHEAMHLQLTLVESVVPLVGSTGATYFSPWRNEYRTAQGVLHALYVFRVIDAFLAALPPGDRDAAAVGSHTAGRRATIAVQLAAVRDFAACPDLTPDGAAFVRRLLG